MQIHNMIIILHRYTCWCNILKALKNNIVLSIDYGEIVDIVTQIMHDRFRN